jgi:hypothetical protein
MKKQIIILSLFIIPLSSWGQQTSTTTTPCTNEMAHKANGNWFKMPDLTSMNSPEAFKRLEAIHNLLFTFYSEPVGVDAAWRRNIGLTYFGAKREHFNIDEGTAPYISLPHFVKYYYECGFFDYRCIDGKVTQGYPGETNAWVKVIANDLTSFIGGDLDCDMNLGGFPVKMRKVLKEKWKGYDLYTSEVGSSDHSVLIHRLGMLPYIPVTRKQYLDHSIKHLTEMYEKIIESFETIPVRTLEEQEKEKNAKLEKFKKDFGSDPKKLKSNVDYYLSGYQTDQQRRDERIAKTAKDKTDIVKRFQDELETTTKEGLLDSPACIVVLHPPDLFTPIFVAEDKGSMLVIDNPDYIRKDLPKHIPQFFVLTWSGMSSGVRGEVGKIIKEKFPIEKLQSMIDH